MATYRLKIVGVHYAVNPDSASSAEETELMHQRTARRLRELEEGRPPVVLIHEPTNPVDARAVMARVEGARIGYVDKTQLDIVHALFQANGGRPLRAHIEDVEAKKHGWMHVGVEAKEEVRMEPHAPCGSEWESWTCPLPVLPATDTQFARMEAELMLDDVFSKHPIAGEMDADTLAGMERYIQLWLDSSLHDLSDEARLTREHYIMALREGILPNIAPSSASLPRIKALVFALEKQRTAICGQKRMNLRVNVWWKELLASPEMNRLRNMWATRANGDVEQSMAELDTLLRALPNDLYAFVDDKKLFFSRLHYSHVPRAKYWAVVSLMLLREGSGERSGEGCNQPLPPEEETFVVTIPKELETPEAKRLLAKLQKKGYLDEDFQPVKLSNTQKSVLAWYLTEHLHIKKRWVVMAALWKCNSETLRKSYDKGYEKNVASEFTKKMKSIIF